MRREIETIFLGLGFEVRTGPWIETEWNNFDALNTPPDHPARDMQDTFFVEGGRILRSHTSPVQIRTMLAGPPPIRIVAPGNVFRRDDDATHTPMFPQMEGLFVDKDVSFADLKGTLLHFVHRFFGPKLGIRLRPSYFPFTEPSAEVDAACYMCAGNGQVEGRSCRLCKGSGWIEIGGSGMVHPNVFRAVGYDPKAGDRVRVRHGAVAHGDAEVRGRRPALVLRARRPLPGAIPMKVSFNWLRELVELKPGVTADSVAQRLTLVGLEVESIERRGRDVAGVVVAEVRGARPHPSAEKLTLVRVVAGGAQPEEVEVVCGAKNVPAAGGKVAWAPPGATLPGGRKLERKDVRGVSSPGMLCSEVELGISEASDGILILSPDAPAGADLARQIGLLDEVLEVNVTPNRPDALSHVGIAREVAALFGAPWRLPAPDAVREIPLPTGRGVDVQIRDAAACPRYNARIITGLAVGPSPLAMRVRLAACGMRAISNLVDVTNYVMLETGHPLHAFDLDKLRGGHPRAPGKPRRTDDHARRRRPPAAGGRRGHRRRRRRDRARGRDGRRGQRDLRDHDRGAARDRDVRSAGDPPDRQAPRPAQRGVPPVRARRRRGRHPAREPPRGDHAGARRRWRGGGRGGRSLSRISPRCGACRCRSRGCRGWRASRFRSRKRPRS